MKSIIRYLGLGVLTVILVACEYKTILIADVEVPEEVSFQNHVIPVFEQNCISCHSSQAFPPILLEEVAYNNLYNEGYLVAGKPDESKLLNKINSGHPNALVPTDEEKEIIRLWIEQGAQNN